MNISQEEADRALALLLASQDYEDDYIAYFENEGRLKKKVKKKKDDTEYRPRKRKASRKSSSGHATSQTITSNQANRENMPPTQGDTCIPIDVKVPQSVAVECSFQGTETSALLVEPMNTGKFSDDEVIRFKEGLELHGRDWAMLAKHVGTRNSVAVRSHAQKYFIRLYRAGLPLPEKVKESGGGYTLSGKELDPNSAAAKPYFLAKSAIDLTTPRPSQVDGGPPSPSTSPKVYAKRLQPPKRLRNSGRNRNEASTEKIPKEAERFSSDESHDSDAFLDDMFYNERTEYAMQRPTRAAAQAKSSSFEAIELLSNTESAHVMLPCERYLGKPASGVVGCQPFTIQLHRRALALMDLHAHLMSTEVIGFLGGKWNPDLKMLEITTAIPCRSVEPSESTQLSQFDDRHFNVELDPQSELETRELIELRQLRVVGWYHSHPTFAPNPSLIDLVNQRNYQKLFNQGDSNQKEHFIVDITEDFGDQPPMSHQPVTEPFVGAIVSPYDPKITGSVSSINWFHVGNHKEDQHRPKRLACDVHPVNTEELVVDSEVVKEFLKLAEKCGVRRDRVNLHHSWRGDKQTRLQKLLSSFHSHLSGKNMKIEGMATSKIDTEEAYCVSSSVTRSSQQLTIEDTLRILSQELAQWSYQ